jgi:lipoate-protein ligase A
VSARSELELPIWRRIDLGPCDPFRAQAFAEAVAVSVGRGDSPNTLLFAQTERPYLSLGFHQSFEEEIDPHFLERHRIPTIRRVEGGGTTYLDPDQLFYQLVYRDDKAGAGGPLDLPRFLAGPVSAAIALGLPAGFRAPSDIVVLGRKFSGNAGGEWSGAGLIVGNFLGRADHRAMADLLRLPHPSLRPLVRREVERWVTSWESETGRFPVWEDVKAALVEGFRAAGLFRTKNGAPTPVEESCFRTETVPRHQDPSWREVPPPPFRPGGPRRRIRIAGPHGLLIFDGSEPGQLGVALVDGSELREGFQVSPGPKEELRPLGAEDPEFQELARSARTESVRLA